MSRIVELLLERKSQSVDIRAERTRKMLIDALEQLLDKKPIEEINVRELCEISTVRRATFYRHFEDKYDFFRYYLQTLTDRFLEASLEEFEGSQFSGLESYTDYMHGQLINFLETHPTIAKLALGNTALVGTLDMMMQQIAVGIARMIETQAKQDGIKLPVSSEYLSIIYAGGMVHGLRWWLASDKPLPRDKMIRANTEMLTKYLTSLISNT